MVTSTKSKLVVFQKQLGRENVDNELDFEWKKVVEEKVSMCSNLSAVCEDEALDKD